MVPMALKYAKANLLKLTMAVREILELTTEDIDAIDGRVEDAQAALDYIDGLVQEDGLSDAGKHIAFVVSEKLGWAEGLAESYAGRAYSLPVRSLDGIAPREFVSAVMSIGRYRLFSRRTTVPDDVLDDYKQAVSWLGLLRDGEVVLNLGTSGTTGATTRSRAGLADQSSVSFSSTI